MSADARRKGLNGKEEAPVAEGNPKHRSIAEDQVLVFRLESSLRRIQVTLDDWAYDRSGAWLAPVFASELDIGAKFDPLSTAVPLDDDCALAGKAFRLSRLPFCPVCFCGVSHAREPRT